MSKENPTCTVLSDLEVLKLQKLSCNSIHKQDQKGYKLVIYLNNKNSLALYHDRRENSLKIMNSNTTIVNLTLL